MTVVALLAHAGGWDELAFVALPIALFAGLLTIANHRARAAEEREAARQPPPDAGEHATATPDPPDVA